MDATPKRGRPRDPAKLAAILTELSGDPAMFLEYGPPPYNVADLARRLGVDPSNLRAYLLALERDGMVIRERRQVDTWNAIAGGHRPRRVLCFWNAATMEQDREAALAWRDGADARSANAAELMFGRFSRALLTCRWSRLSDSRPPRGICTGDTPSAARGSQNATPCAVTGRALAARRLPPACLTWTTSTP